MQKNKLDLSRIDVMSFETELPREPASAGVITGTPCVTRPTIYGTCCTP